MNCSGLGRLAGFINPSRWHITRRFRRAFGTATMAEPTDSTTISTDDTADSNATMDQNATAETPGNEPAVRRECDVCCEDGCVVTLIKVCEYCAWCENCVRDSFQRAISRSMSMPPRCCAMVPLHVGLPYLTEKEAVSFRLRFEEWATAGLEKLYCPAPSCREFVPLRAMGIKSMSDSVDKSTTSTTYTKSKVRRDTPLDTPPNDVAIDTSTSSVTCPHCSTAICLRCKAFAHDDTTTCNPHAGIDEKLAARLKQLGYKQCPHCGNGVRRMYGCSHMQCLCGEHFCWNCGKTLDECGDDGDCDPDAEMEDGDEFYDGASDVSVEMVDVARSSAASVAGSVEDYMAAGYGTDCISAAMEHERLLNLDTISGGDPTLVGQIEEANRNCEIAFERQKTNSTAEPSITDPQPSTLPVQDAPPARARMRNLDGGGSGIWEMGNLDFGDEPTENTHEATIWSKWHMWKMLPEMFSATEEDKPLRVECHVCWAKLDVRASAETVAAGEEDGEGGRAGWQCRGCRLPVCYRCKD